jgi:hypothetical protein
VAAIDAAVVQETTTTAIEDGCIVSRPRLEGLATGRVVELLRRGHPNVHDGGTHAQIKAQDAGAGIAD